MAVKARRLNAIPSIPYQADPSAGDAFSQNTLLRQQNRAGADAHLGAVEETFGDPMHALQIGNASQNAITAATDVNGMGAVLQGVRNAAEQKGKRAGMSFSEPSAEDPSAKSPASWNPAGQTQDAALRDVQQFIHGGAMPEGVAQGSPDTQEAFRRRVLQGIKGAKV